MEFTLSSGAAAARLGVTPQAVRDMHQRGDLSAQRRQHGTRPRLYFSEAEVEALRKRRAGDVEQ